MAKQKAKDAKKQAGLEKKKEKKEEDPPDFLSPEEKKMRAEEKKKEKKIPVDPDKTLPTASAAAIVTFLDATWVPYWNGKAKKKLDDDKLKKAGLVSDAHLKKLDPFFFPLPKRIDPQELKDFTEPFVDDMKSLNDELKSATEAAIKAAKAAALKKKLAE